MFNEGLNEPGPALSTGSYSRHRPVAGTREANRACCSSHLINVGARDARFPLRPREESNLRFLHSWLASRNSRRPFSALDVGGNSNAKDLRRFGWHSVAPLGASDSRRAP